MHNEIFAIKVFTGNADKNFYHTHDTQLPNQ